MAVVDILEERLQSLIKITETLAPMHESRGQDLTVKRRLSNQDSRFSSGHKGTGTAVPPCLTFPSAIQPKEISSATCRFWHWIWARLPRIGTANSTSLRNICTALCLLSSHIVDKHWWSKFSSILSWIQLSQRERLLQALLTGRKGDFPEAI